MDNRPIAIIDSGLGGLAIAQTIWSVLPQESTLYLADHAFFPYGNRSNQQINRRLVRILNFIIAKNCKAAVIACNTITVSSIDFLRKLYSLPFIGTVPAIKPAIAKNLKENIVILATSNTVKSRYHQNLIKSFDKKGQIKSLACPSLVEAIENYFDQPEKIKLNLKKHLNKIKTPYSALVLGCTHYILIKDLIKQVTPEHVLIIEPSLAIAEQTAKVLITNHLQAAGSPAQQEFFTTGDPKRASQAASGFLKQRIIFSSCSL